MCPVHVEYVLCLAVQDLHVFVNGNCPTTGTCRSMRDIPKHMDVKK